MEAVEFFSFGKKPQQQLQCLPLPQQHLLKTKLVHCSFKGTNINATYLPEAAMAATLEVSPPLAVLSSGCPIVPPDAPDITTVELPVVPVLPVMIRRPVVPVVGEILSVVAVVAVVPVVPVVNG
jgi:hypothetical protein